MRIFLILTSIITSLVLTGCETMNSQQESTVATENTTPKKSTPQAAKDAGVDCNEVPRSKDQIAIYRKHCL